MEAATSPIPAFRVGDKVVYPNHGVGVIEHIANRPAGACERQFYLLRIEASNLRVMVPCDNVISVGMRAVAPAAELEGMLVYLRQSGQVASSTDWKWRFKENSDKMRNGALAQVAEVLKGLVQLHQSKPLSFREKKMLDRAALLLVSEMASIRHLSQDQALDLLRQALETAALTLPPFEEATA